VTRAWRTFPVDAGEIRPYGRDISKREIDRRYDAAFKEIRRTKMFQIEDGWARRGNLPYSVRLRSSKGAA
jgi:hypothetical protein